MNVVDRRPPGNNFKIFYRDSKKFRPTEYLEERWGIVREILEDLSPDIVICLGGEALRAVTGRVGIVKWRGSVIQTGNIKSIATYHPAYLFHKPDHQVIVKNDLAKALRHLTPDPFFPPEYEFFIPQSPKEVAEWFGDLSSEEPLAFDLETFGRDDGPHIRCVGFSKSPTQTMCVPFALAKEDIIFVPGEDIRLGGVASYWSPQDEVEVAYILREVLENPEIPKVAQNYAFDATILALRWGLIVQGLFLDTMHLFHCLWPELPKNLDFLTSVYTDQPYYAGYNPAIDVETWEYNQIDCAVTFQVGAKLQEESNALGMWDFYKTQVEPGMYGLTRMMNRGVRIDPEAQAEQARTVRVKRERLLKEIQDEGPKKEIKGKKPAGYRFMDITYPTKAACMDQIRKHAKTWERTIKSCAAEIEKLPPKVKVELFNPDSPPQVQAYLYQDLRLPVQKSRATGKTTGEEEALHALLRKDLADGPRAFIQTLLEYRNKTKLLQFLQPNCDWDGRIRTSYNISGTKNGRISSSQSIFGSGANLQQQPNDPEFRSIFLPDTGHLWVKVDLAAAEARVVAWDAGLNALRDRFLHDPTFDIHKWNAGHIFEVPEGEVTGAQRRLGKVGVHGGNYGLGARGASKRYDIPYRDAKRSLDAYKEALPELADWWRGIQHEIKTNRLLISPLGRRRTFLGRLDDEAFRSGYSFIPQSVVGDIINRAAAWAEYLLAPLGGYPLLQVHDELDFSIPRKNLDLAKSKIKNLMEPPVKYEGQPDLVIPTEISVGPSWGQAEIFV
jgi:DNA polymerase-1